MMKDFLTENAYCKSNKYNLIGHDHLNNKIKLRCDDLA